MTLFEDVLGQQKATGLLSRALEGNRLAHAYLFSGPEGVGKRMTAARFAGALLCDADENKTKPCGRCRSCIQFAAGSSPDFLRIVPQGATIRIDQVRELKKSLGYPPLESPRRVVLLEDAHTMRREAANSLLKLLEEPPPDNILLLTALDSEPLLPTILSRCQVIPFYPLDPDAAARIIAGHDPSLTGEKAARLARLTGGCPGLARDFEAAELLPVYDEVIDALVDRYEGEAARVERALAVAGHTAELKDNLEALLDLLRFFFRDCMLAMLRDGAGKEEITSDHRAHRARELWNLEQVSDKVQVIDFVTKALARNCNRLMACEVLMLSLLCEDKNDALRLS
ncbi:MAG: DNA polymerase III subunit delta' [Desulfobulbaceae bacterium]